MIFVWRFESKSRQCLPQPWRFRATVWQSKSLWVSLVALAPVHWENLAFVFAWARLTLPRTSSSPHHDPGGFANFLSIYNLIITARILLSWFPQAQGIGALQPVYAITDPYLNLFRGVVPPLFGLDFSPILAFFLLNLLGNATAAVGYEIPPDLRQKKKYSALRPSRGGMIARLLPQQRPTVFRSRHNNNNKKQNDLTLNY